MDYITRKMDRCDSYYYCDYCYSYFIASYKKQHLKSLKHLAKMLKTVLLESNC